MENTKDISALVSELLFHYDCVIVPEFGGFVTEYRSARIDAELSIIHPPSKDLRFNAQLKKNDGLLANAVSQATSLSHEAANVAIKKAVEGYFSELDGGRTVVFEKVGILYLDSQKNMQFRADESVNYLLESFRLKKVYAQQVAAEVNVIQEPVAAIIPPIPEEVLVVAIQEKKLVPVKPITVESPVAEKEVPTESAEVLPISTAPSHRRWLAAALIPLLLYLGFVAVRSDVVSDGNIQMSDLNPFKKAALNTMYSERDVVPTFEFEEVTIPLSEEIVLAEEKIADPTPEEVTPELPVQVAPPIVSEDKQVAKAVTTYVAPKEVSAMEFHVIGGCFGDLENAESLVSKLRQKGFPAHIIDTHKGLHRVAYGSYIERSEALNVLRAVKEDEQQEAWLLRKK